MELLKSAAVACPYCGEILHIDIDCSVSQQSYIEDCQVCCRPINVNVEIDNDFNPAVRVRHEDH